MRDKYARRSYLDPSRTKDGGVSPLPSTKELLYLLAAGSAYRVVLELGSQDEAFIFARRIIDHKQSTISSTGAFSVIFLTFRDVLISLCFQLIRLRPLRSSTIQYALDDSHVQPQRTFGLCFWLCLYLGVALDLRGLVFRDRCHAPARLTAIDDG